MVNSRNIGDEKIVFAQSPKGRDMLLYGGHKYVLSHVNRKGEKIWRCNSASKFRCSAGAKTFENTYEPIRTHNHPRESFPIKVLKMKNTSKIKQEKL